MQTFTFDEQNYKKYHNKGGAITLALLVTLGLIWFFDQSMLPFFILPLVVITLALNKPIDYSSTTIDGNKVDFSVALEPDVITVDNKFDDYKFTRKRTQLTSVKTSNYFGLPVITMEFEGRESIKLYNLESSNRLYEQLSKDVEHNRG